MEPINHNRSVWQKAFCDREIVPIHIHHEVLHLFSAWKLPQIVVNLLVFARWEYVYNLFVRGIGQDALEFFMFRVSSKFVDGKDLRQQWWFPELQQVHPTANG